MFNTVKILGYEYFIILWVSNPLIITKLLFISKLWAAILRIWVLTINQIP